MSSGADWSRTCEGCAHVVDEPGPKGRLWASEIEEFPIAVTKRRFGRGGKC